MSSQKGNSIRKRPQKHKNTKAFQNDLHDTSHTIKKIKSLEFYGICNRCKDIIDWKVKYKKYKQLTTSKKCVKCLEKKGSINKPINNQDKKINCFNFSLFSSQTCLLYSLSRLLYNT
jgi:RNA polymerase-binding transcription factor DksA